MFSEKMSRYLEDLCLICSDLIKEIHGLESVLAKEADAISRSDINELELITKEKVSYGIQIESMVKKLKTSGDSVFYDFGNPHRESKSQRRFRLEDLLQDLKLLIVENGSPAELDAIWENLNQVVLDLRNARKEVFPKVESNSYLVKKLLQYHRETYAFWQSVAGDSEAIYGKTGKAKAVPQRSILTVRT